MFSDTHPDAQRVQIESLRKATALERLAKALSLSATVVNLSRQTIVQRYPDLSAQELNLKCVEFYYGKDLAARVRDYLKTERHDVAF